MCVCFQNHLMMKFRSITNKMLAQIKLIKSNCGHLTEEMAIIQSYH